MAFIMESLSVYICHYILFLFALSPYCPSQCSLNLLLITLKRQNKIKHCIYLWQGVAVLWWSESIGWRSVLSVHLVEVSWGCQVGSRCLSPPMPLSTAFLVFKLCVCTKCGRGNLGTCVKMKGQFSRDEILLPHGTRNENQGIRHSGQGFMCWTSSLVLEYFQVSIGYFHYFFWEFAFQFY